MKLERGTIKTDRCGTDHLPIFIYPGILILAQGSEVWTRVLWILRVPPDKRAFSRAGMFVCQPWLWLDTCRHHQFRGITSIKSPASAAAQASPAATDADLHVTHRQKKQTQICLRAFSGFCGPSPVLRAFSGFSGLLRVCVLPQPLRARSFLFLFFSKKRRVEKALSTWEKPMAKNQVPYSENAHRLFPGVSCLLSCCCFSSSGGSPPSRFCVGLIESPV